MFERALTKHTSAYASADFNFVPTFFELAFVPIACTIRQLAVLKVKLGFQSLELGDF